MLVGAIIALQLPYWQANLGEYLSFGRLRPLHTNAVIFAFAGNAIFAAIYYSSQRLLKTRMFSDGMSRFHFWGWQANRQGNWSLVGQDVFDVPTRTARCSAPH